MFFLDLTPEIRVHLPSSCMRHAAISLVTTLPVNHGRDDVETDRYPPTTIALSRSPLFLFSIPLLHSPLCFTGLKLVRAQNVAHISSHSGYKKTPSKNSIGWDYYLVFLGFFLLALQAWSSPCNVVSREAWRQRSSEGGEETPIWCFYCAKCVLAAISQSSSLLCIPLGRVGKGKMNEVVWMIHQSCGWSWTLLVIRNSTVVWSLGKGCAEGK